MEESTDDQNVPSLIRGEHRIEQRHTVPRQAGRWRKVTGAGFHPLDDRRRFAVDERPFRFGARRRQARLVAAIEPEPAACLAGGNPDRPIVVQPECEPGLMGQHLRIDEQPSKSHDVFIEAESRAFRNFVRKAERRRHLFVEPPGIEAKQEDGWRDRRRERHR